MFTTQLLLDAESARLVRKALQYYRETQAEIRQLEAPVLLNDPAAVLAERVTDQEIDMCLEIELKITKDLRKNGTRS